MTSRNIAPYLRHVFAASLFAAGITIGTTAGNPTTAFAVPNSGDWDVGAYDRCIAAVDDAWARGLIEDITGAHRECCEKSGGVWSPLGPEPGNAKCVAPPAKPAQAQPGTSQRPGVATQTSEPSPPPVARNPEVTLTFVPAPVG